MWRTVGIGARVVADDAVSASANNFVFGRDGRGAGIAWLGILGHAFPSLPWEDLVGPELRRAGTDRGPRGGGSKWGGADDVLSHDRRAGEGGGVRAPRGDASGRSGHPSAFATAVIVGENGVGSSPVTLPRSVSPPGGAACEFPPHR